MLIGKTKGNPPHTDAEKLPLQKPRRFSSAKINFRIPGDIRRAAVQAGFPPKAFDKIFYAGV